MLTRGPSESILIKALTFSSTSGIAIEKIVAPSECPNKIRSLSSVDSIHSAAPTLILNSGEEIPIPSDSSGLGASDMNSSEHTSLFSVSSGEPSLEIEYDFEAFIQHKAKQQPSERHGAHLLRPHPKSKRSQPSDFAVPSKVSAQNGGTEHTFPTSADSSASLMLLSTSDIPIVNTLLAGPPIMGS